MRLLVVFALLGATMAEWSKDMEAGMYQGDMVLNPEQQKAVQEGSFSYGSVTYGRWPGAKVPYVIESSIGSRGRTAISQAIAEYHRFTCIRYSPRTNQRNYISFYNGGGCFSPVGMNRNSYNRISLGSGCWSKGTAEHEIGHSLGLFHEQSRPDRDRYVTINFGNIQRGMGYNFNIQKNIDSLGTPYDLQSMMHYSSTAFAVRGRTIVAKDPSKQHYIDTYNRIAGFSQTDIRQLNLMYKCGGTQPTQGPTQTPVTGGPGVCDNKEQHCDYWAKEGYCDDEKEGQFMKDNCCKACKDIQCTDNHQHCAYWAGQGYCATNDYCKQNCKKSCKLC